MVSAILSISYYRGTVCIGPQLPPTPPSIATYSICPTCQRLQVVEELARMTDVLGREVNLEILKVRIVCISNK